MDKPKEQLPGSPTFARVIEDFGEFAAKGKEAAACEAIALLRVLGHIYEQEYQDRDQVYALMRHLKKAAGEDKPAKERLNVKRFLLVLKGVQQGIRARLQKNAGLDTIIAGDLVRDTFIAISESEDTPKEGA